MPTLHLGVVDVPYQAPPSETKRQARVRRWRSKAKPWQQAKWRGVVNTGDVAEWLEDKYGVVRCFAEELHPEVITGALERAMADKLEALLLGAPIDTSLSSLDLSEIETAFRQAIEGEEFDGKIEGVPTQAALRGVNHRLKHPYAKDNPPRQSLFDTHLYHDSFAAWIED